LSAAGSNPLGRIGEVIAAIGPLDDGAMQAARARQARLTKPPGSLGRLETLSIQLAGITGSALPSFARKAVIVAAADHGVAADGVSAYPPAVTAQMALNFARGGAAINVLARQAGALVVVVDVGIAADWGLPAPSTAVRKSWPFGPAGERPAVSPPTPKGAELPPVGEGRAMMGDTLEVSDGQDVQVTASWAGCPEGAELCLVADGKPNVTIPAGNADTRTWKLDGGEMQWCLLTLRGADGQMLALTNPVFFERRTQSEAGD
jgi:hypothetical protein